MQNKIVNIVWVFSYPESSKLIISSCFNNKSYSTGDMVTVSDEIPLFIVGLPKDEPNVDLVAKKFRGVLNRVEKGISKIHEARIAIKIVNSRGKRRTYEVSILIKTQRKRFAYKDSGWDLSEICETIGQKLLRENTQNKKAKRQKQSIRKIKEKLF